MYDLANVFKVFETRSAKQLGEVDLAQACDDIVPVLRMYGLVMNVDSVDRDTNNASLTPRMEYSRDMKSKVIVRGNFITDTLRDVFGTVTGEFDEELLAQRFHRLDRDGSGALSKNELRVFIASLSPNVRASARISDDMVDDMLNKMDLDGDGEISIDEFMTAMRAMYQAKKNRKKVPRAQPSPRGGGRGGVAAGRGTPYGRGGGRGAGRGAGRGGASPGIQQLQQAHPSGGRGRGGPQRGRGGPARGRGRGAPRI